MKTVIHLSSKQRILSSPGSNILIGRPCSPSRSFSTKSRFFHCEKNGIHSSSRQRQEFIRHSIGSGAGGDISETRFSSMLLSCGEASTSSELHLSISRLDQRGADKSP